jgi:hypothetical protein
MSTADSTRPDVHHFEQGDLLTERFTRVFGRPPTPGDLTRFQRARTGLELRLPAQVRRVAATVVANL